MGEANPTTNDGALVVHAADLHLGAPLDSLGRFISDAHAAHLRGLASTAFDRLVARCLDPGATATALVLAGDVYDDADREVSAQLRFDRGLRDLRDGGVHVYVVHGNHDPLAAQYESAARLPDNVTVFAPGDVQVHELAHVGGHGWHVAGVSFGSRHERANLAERFGAIEGRVDPGRCIGVLHTQLDGTRGHAPYAPCTTADLLAGPVAYWALGHIHLRTVAALGPGRWYAYPGNLQGRSTKPAECGPKGALRVTLGPHGVAEPRFVACDAIRFLRLDVDVSDAADAADAIGLARDAAGATAAQAPEVPLLLRLRLVGASRAHRALANLELLDEVRQEAPEIGDGALVGVDDATRPAVDRQQLLDRHDLVAELLTRLDALRAAPPDAVLASVTDAMGHGPSERLVSSWCDEDPSALPSLLDAVERQLLDALVPEL